MENTLPVWFSLVCTGGLFLLFGAVGGFLIYQSIQQRKKAAASQSWPSTTGQISSTDVAHSTSTDSEGDTTDTYSPRIRYSYHIMGNTYSGDKIGIGFQQSFSSNKKAEEITARYPAGAQVPVYYNPANPNEAVLERKASSSTVTMVIGVIFAVIAICSACSGIIALLFSVTEIST